MPLTLDQSKFLHDLALSRLKTAGEEGDMRARSILNAFAVLEQKSTEVKEILSNMVKLDKENYGAPPENSGIIVRNKVYSTFEPCAWKDSSWNWFYNFAGAIKLAKVLERTLPSIDQLMIAMHTNPDNFRQNAGYLHNQSIGKICEQNEASYFWSSTDFWSKKPAHTYVAHYAFLNQGDSSGKFMVWTVTHGCSVRFIEDNF